MAGKTVALCLDPGGTTGVALLEYNTHSYNFTRTWQIKNGLRGFLDFHWDELIDIKIDQLSAKTSTFGKESGV